MVEAEVIPVRQDMDREGNTFTLYAYNRYTPSLTRPVLERVVPCPGNKLLCALYGNETITIDRDKSWEYRGIVYGNQLVHNGDLLNEQNSIPYFGEDNRTIMIDNFWGANFNYSVILEPDIFEDAVILPEAGTYIYTNYIQVEGIKYNYSTRTVTLPDNNTIKIREPILDINWEYNLSWKPVTFIVDAFDDVIYFHVMFNLTEDELPARLDPSYEFDETEGIKDTYIRSSVPNTDQSSSVNLLINTVEVTPAKSNSTVLQSFNVTGINNESFRCNVTNANITYWIVWNRFSSPVSADGRLRLYAMQRNWSDTSGWFNNSMPCTAGDELCLWNVSGAQGTDTIGVIDEHNSRKKWDRVEPSATDITYDYVVTSSGLFTLFNANPAFNQLVEEWVNGSRSSYEHGFQLAAEYEPIFGKSISMIINSEDSAVSVRRPHLRFECDFIPVDDEDDCSPPAATHWIPTVNVTCIDKNITVDCGNGKGLIINPGIWVNFTRTNFTTYFIWNKIGSRFIQSDYASARGCS